MDEKTKDLKDAKELELFTKSSAGLIVIALLKKQVNEMMFKFVSELNNPDLHRYIALSCELKEKLELIKKFEGAGDIRQIIEESLEAEA
jgi:hypothetical protein